MGFAVSTGPLAGRPGNGVRAGAGLTNEYRRQPGGVTGLVAVGDAFCTTNPQGARGVSLGLQSAAVLADLVQTGTPTADLAAALDAWGAAELFPWCEDHVVWDPSLLAWAGRAVVPDGPSASTCGSPPSRSSTPGVAGGNGAVLRDGGSARRARSNAGRGAGDGSPGLAAHPAAGTHARRARLARASDSDRAGAGLTSQCRPAQSPGHPFGFGRTG